MYPPNRAVLYLNEPSWDTERQGGSLRCYVKGEEEAVGAGGATGPAATRIISLSATNKSQQDQQRWQHMDIAPQGGRLVLFDSKAVLHEVLPSHQGVGRMALTVWISDRAARWW